MDLTEKQIFTLVARAECDFKIPIMLEDQLIVSLVISRIGASSFDIDYRLHDSAEKTYATARTIMVCFDNAKQVTVPVPECIRTMGV
jgi:acyl-CoA thioester hydrolase